MPSLTGLISFLEVLLRGVMLAIFVGWARWLEVRLSPPDNRAPGWLWTVGFALIAVLLLLYREA